MNIFCLILCLLFFVFRFLSIHGIICVTQRPGRAQTVGFQVKWQEFLRSLEKQRDCWNSWRPCSFVEQSKTLDPCFLCVFFGGGDGVGLYHLYSCLGLSCILVVAISLLSEQYLLWWDREQFDSKWFLEKIWKTVINEKQPKNSHSCMKQMCEAVAFPCCSYIC